MGDLVGGLDLRDYQAVDFGADHGRDVVGAVVGREAGLGLDGVHPDVHAAGPVGECGGLLHVRPSPDLLVQRHRVFQVQDHAVRAERGDFGELPGLVAGRE